MALQILILPTEPPAAPAVKETPGTRRWCRAPRVRRRLAAYEHAPQGPALGIQLDRHWSSLAVRTSTPRPLGLCARPRSGVSPFDFLRQTEALLRLLLRRRLRTAGLTQRDLVRTARTYDVQRHRAAGGCESLAYLLTWMHWRGCSIPEFLFKPPLHPATGLVRWLSTFSVVYQVDHGLQVLEELAHEETRVFENALALMRHMQRMKARRSNPGLCLLPGLLAAQSGPETDTSDRFTTAESNENNDLRAQTKRRAHRNWRVRQI